MKAAIVARLRRAEVVRPEPPTAGATRFEIERGGAVRSLFRAHMRVAPRSIRDGCSVADPVSPERQVGTLLPSALALVRNWWEKRSSSV
jgi:hypothetical protein